MSRRKRGRPRKSDAKRRTTTRAGRRSGRDPVDSGTDQLKSKRLALTTSETLCQDDPLAALYGRHILTTAQFNAGRDISELIAIVAAAHVGSVWQRILTAPGGVLSFDPSPNVERAQRSLRRLKPIIGDRALKPVIALCEGEWLPLVRHIVTRQFETIDWLTVIDIRDSLDRVADHWSGTAAA